MGNAKQDTQKRQAEIKALQMSAEEWSRIAETTSYIDIKERAQSRVDKLNDKIKELRGY